MNRFRRQKIGLIPQVALMFVFGVIIVGLVTYSFTARQTNRNIRRQTETMSQEIMDEVMDGLREYPAYDWLVRFWYENADVLDIEYDATFVKGTRNEAKVRDFYSRHPGLAIRYAYESSLERLSYEDQKLYAEITYSWMITRLNETKRAFGIDYLFCVISNAPYDTQFFLFSAAEPGAKRGTNYEEVYMLGTTVSVSESQQEAMRLALENNTHLADAGDYVDYYAYFGKTNDLDVFIGLTTTQKALLGNIRMATMESTIAAAISMILLSVAVLFALYNLVLKPLSSVQKSIRKYTEIKDSETVIDELSFVRSQNEIGGLAKDVMSLAGEMEEYTTRIASITAEKERISTELDTAKEIQASMMPSIFPPFPDRSEFDIYASMEPARAVGGDFYDFFMIDQDHLGLVIADVSGKGIPAALFMMVAKIILQNCSMYGRSPAEIISRSNDSICMNNRQDMFVTVWAGILELSTGKLTAANAGHEYPVFMQNGRFELFKDPHGPVVGAMEGLRYKEYEVQLLPGDKIFVYTDGLPEATDPDQKMFGLERVVETLNASADGSPEDILKDMRKAVGGFVRDAEQFDDLTMLCLEYKGVS
ncbi:MAG: serine/threonine-protein phosphatase [Lachnospiraceae bacterium]|nr:serine/threonine-protein phosphatase [Lachnospiraceae bacterium]